MCVLRHHITCVHAHLCRAVSCFEGEVGFAAVKHESAVRAVSVVGYVVFAGSSGAGLGVRGQ